MNIWISDWSENVPRLVNQAIFFSHSDHTLFIYKYPSLPLCCPERKQKSVSVQYTEPISRIYYIRPWCIVSVDILFVCNKERVCHSTLRWQKHSQVLKNYPTWNEFLAAWKGTKVSAASYQSIDIKLCFVCSYYVYSAVHLTLNLT